MPEKLTLEDRIDICSEAAEISNNIYSNKTLQGTTVWKILNKFETIGNINNNFKEKHHP